MTQKVENKFVDALVSELNLKNDAALARLIAVKPSAISKIRHGRLNASAEVILALHEKAGMKIKRIRELMALGK
jgi:hypothetical protein